LVSAKNLARLKGCGKCSILLRGLLIVKQKSQTTFRLTPFTIAVSRSLVPPTWDILAIPS